MKKVLLTIACLFAFGTAASAQCGGCPKAKSPSSLSIASNGGSDVHYIGLFKQYHIIGQAQQAPAPQMMPQTTDPAVLSQLAAIQAQNAAILQQLQQQHLQQQLQGLKAPTSPQILYVPPTLGAPSYSPPVLGAPSYSPPVLGAPSYAPPTLGAPSYIPPVLGAPVYTPPVYSPGPILTPVPKPAPSYVPPTLGAPRSTSAPQRFTTHALAKPTR